MARISLDPPRTLSYRVGEWFIRRRFGAVVYPYRAMGHNMGVTRAFARMEHGVTKWNRLPPAIRDLADLKAAMSVGCPWCMDFGYWKLHTNGVPPEKLDALPAWRESTLFDPLERLALEYAEAMTATPPAVDDELFAALRERLNEAPLVELTAIVCVENLRSRFNSALGLTRQGFKERCEIHRAR